MRLIDNIEQMKGVSSEARLSQNRVGLVPTMGYLHEGHLSLVRTARAKCDLLVVSVFVNPTQFGEGEDFESYPRDMNHDVQLLEREGTDVVFVPSAEEMYPEGHFTYVDVLSLTSIMCGRKRPGHFRGVTTVLAKLFNIVRPDFAVFGEKDYQQAVVIKRMTRDLNMDVDIIVCPTVREGDGLAMSSRNAYLSKKEREDAAVLYQSLEEARKIVASGGIPVSEVRDTVRKMIEEKDTATVEYVSVVHPETLEELDKVDAEAVVAVAVAFGKARLIDNIRVGRKEPN
jgi:pantoate--beta-alanine ligase